jgi:hypothetical protein
MNRAALAWEIFHIPVAGLVEFQLGQKLLFVSIRFGRKAMKKIVTLAFGLAIIGLLTIGCDKKDTTATSAAKTNNAVAANTSTPPATTKASLEADICGKCGCCAGCEDCCNKDAEICDKCGFQKGTQMCCVEGMSPKDGVKYCKECGQEKDSDSCCKEDAEKCADCGLAKGSPGCAVCCKGK